MEEAFANELLLLACKVISKTPDFHHNFDTTLKQQYANQMYDCNNASIAKTLLLQMPKVTFIQFHNKLARVLGTHQHFNGSTKAVSVSAVGTSLDGKEMTLKSQQKCKAKMSAQSSQIRDLCSKLYSAIMENSQMWEFLNPSMLPTMVTNALQAIAVMVTIIWVQDKASLSWVDPGNLNCQLERMGPLTLRRLVTIARIQGMSWIIACISNTRKTS